MGFVWICVLAGVFSVVCAAYFLRLRVDLSARAQGEPDGSWAVAFGCQIGFFALSAATACGVPLTVAVHVFGKQRVFRGRGRRAKAKKVAPRVLKGASAKLESWLDPSGPVYALFGAPRPLRLRFLRVDLGYSFRDAALTGRLLGAVYALSALLPAKVVVRQEPRWDFDDRWSIDVTGRVVVRPGPLFVHLLWSVIDRKLFSRRTRPSPRELTSVS